MLSPAEKVMWAGPVDSFSRAVAARPIVDALSPTSPRKFGPSKILRIASTPIR